MKKTISISIFMALLTMLFSACGMSKLKIEDYEWKMRYVMHGEDNQVVVDAVGEDDIAHPEAKTISLTLSAKDGKITLFDHTNNKTYEGAYTVERKTPAGTDYKIMIDGKAGYATVAMTTYSDGTEEPTLPINLGTHSFYFYAE